ncbi:MAG: HEAT repeat domain-containing protein [Fimbriimonas sp.]
MKRLVAALVFALTASSFAASDERGVERALAEWEALFLPLATARGADLVEVADKIGVNSALRYQAMSRVRNAEYDRLARISQGAARISDLRQREDEAEKRILATLNESYSQADPRGRRVLIRLAAILGDWFEGGSVPIYPTCGNRAFSLNDEARSLFRKWVEATPATHLGLLDDPDPRVAEIATRSLAERFPEEVGDRISIWQRSPHSRFRGIALVNLSGLPEQEKARAAKRFLDDPDESLRDWLILRFWDTDEKPLLTKEEVAAFYETKRPSFGRTTPALKRTILKLGEFLRRKDVDPLALEALNHQNPSLRAVAFETIFSRNIVVPAPVLTRLFKASSSDERESAYALASKQGLSIRDVLPGLRDPDERVRNEAFRACCRGAETREDLKLLLTQAEQFDGIYSLADAAARLGEVAVEDALGLLDRPEPELRNVGINMACATKSPRIVADMERMVLDPDKHVRCNLASEVLRLPDASARRILERLLTDAEEDVRDQAQSSLEALDERARKGN